MQLSSMVRIEHARLLNGTELMYLFRGGDTRRCRAYYRIRNHWEPIKGAVVPVEDRIILGEITL